MKFNKKKYFDLAKNIAVSTKNNDIRTFLIGAIGIREDGIIVSSRNISSRDRCKHAHAETRLVKKLGKNSYVFVARVTRIGNIGLAKPCINCEIALRNKGVKKVYYTIDNKNFGILDLSEN
jgi:tRNA(Arg) A34 adenosine deaminase TadA